MDLALVKDLPENDEELVAEVRCLPQISGAGAPGDLECPYFYVFCLLSHGQPSSQ